MEPYPSGQFGFIDHPDRHYGNCAVWTRTRTRIEGPEPLLTLELPKHQQSSLLKRVSQSNRGPSARALVLPKKSSGDQNISQPKASSDQNIHQHQKATLEVAKWFMEAIVFTMTPWPILSDLNYSIVEEA